MTSSTTSDEVSRPKIPGKLYFRIGEVTEITGVQPYTLRHWEMEFPTLTPKKNDAGQRLYRRTDIEMVVEIQRLLHLEGYTTAGARRLLSQRAKSGVAGGGPGPAKAAKPAPGPKPPAKPSAKTKPEARTESKESAAATATGFSGKMAAPAGSSPAGSSPKGTPSSSRAAAREALALMERNDRLLADLLDPA